MVSAGQGALIVPAVPINSAPTACLISHSCSGPGPAHNFAKGGLVKLDEARCALMRFSISATTRPYKAVAAVEVDWSRVGQISLPPTKALGEWLSPPLGEDALLSTVLRVSKHRA